MNCKNFEPQKIPVTCILYFHELACCGFNWHTPLCSSYFLFQTNFTSSKCSFCITGTDVKFDLPKFPLDSPNVLRESLNNRPQLAAVPIPLNPGRGVSLAEDLRTQTDYDEVDRSCSDQKEEMTQWTSFQWLNCHLHPYTQWSIQSLISVLPGYTKWRTNTFCFVWPVEYHTHSFWSDLSICPIELSQSS